MERLITKKLKEWYLNGDERILWVSGAHGVGKTWTVRGFCREYDREYIHLSMENSDGENINKEISARATFIILDDINSEDAYIRARRIILKMRSDEALSDYKIIMVGAMAIGAIDAEATKSYEYICNVQMFPLSFYEFYQLIEEKWKRTNRFNLSILDVFKIYLIVGGMPECVALFMQEESFTSVRHKQREIVRKVCARQSSGDSIMFAKEIEVVESISVQGKDNRSGFSLRQARTTARWREYGKAIDKMLSCGFIYRISRYDVHKRAKNYCLCIMDVGLAGAMADIDERLILNKDKIIKEHNGLLLKGFIIQEYYARGFYKEWMLNYWHKQRAKARLPILFVHQVKNHIIAVDIEKMWHRSMDSFLNQYNNVCEKTMSIDDVTSEALSII